jgi:transcriptional regulator with XRE-family HTH domain
MHRQVNIQRLLGLREARGWSQEHLAEVAGISLRTVQRMEAGRPVSANAFQAVSSAFDTQVSELLAKPSAKNPIAPCANNA